jgi:hypothetical protein
MGLWIGPRLGYWSKVLQCIDDLPRLMANHAINANPTCLLKLFDGRLCFRAKAAIYDTSVVIDGAHLSIHLGSLARLLMWELSNEPEC